MLQLFAIIIALLAIICAAINSAYPKRKDIANKIIIGCAIGIIITIVLYFKDPINTGDRNSTTETTTTVKTTATVETTERGPKVIDFFTLETYSQDTNYIHIDDLYSKANTGDKYGKSMYYLYNGHMTDNSVSSQIYYLNKKYITFTGTVFLPFQSRSAISPDYPSVFRIYVDNTLAYEAPPFKSGQNPVSFSVDVSECTYLEIKMGGSWYDYSVGVNLRPVVCLANAEITEKEK